MNRFAAYFFTLCAALLLVAPSQAQDDLADEPGYVDVSAFERFFNRPPKIEVNLSGSLLRMVAKASEESNADLHDLLSKLKGIYVRGFEADSTRLDELDRRMTQIADRLENEGWETVVRVREDGEHANVYVRLQGDAIAGLTVLASDPTDETVFVNIVGEIHPEEMGKLGRTLGIDPLKKLARADTSRQ